MKNGVLREDEGFDIVVDGTNRTFSDIYDTALEAARNPKTRNRTSLIQIRRRSDGHMIEMLEDGRIK